jgi:predicted TIM-barrel fold metal-dependent hydrolase
MFESEFWRIEAIDCSEEIKEKIFHGNAEKLYIK